MLAGAQLFFGGEKTAAMMMIARVNAYVSEEVGVAYFLGTFARENGGCSEKRKIKRLLI